jgi:hypothetical protein
MGLEGSVQIAESRFEVGALRRHGASAQLFDFLVWRHRRMQGCRKAEDFLYSH